MNTVETIKTLNYNALRVLAKKEEVDVGSRPNKETLLSALSKHYRKQAKKEETTDALSQGRPPKVETDILIKVRKTSGSRETMLANLELDNTTENLNWLSVRLSNLRSQGFALPPFPRGRKAQDEVEGKAA